MRGFFPPSKVCEGRGGGGFVHLIKNEQRVGTSGWNFVWIPENKTSIFQKKRRTTHIRKQIINRFIKRHHKQLTKYESLRSYGLGETTHTQHAKCENNVLIKVVNWFSCFLPCGWPCYVKTQKYALIHQ